MTLEEQLETLRKAQQHYEWDASKKEANMEYTPVEHKEYASKGVAGSGLGLGIAGTALALLSNNGGLGGLLGNSQRYITKDEGVMMQQLTAKDAEISLLKADKYTDQKIVEAYKDLSIQISNTNARIDALKDAQNAINTQQVALNASQAATIQCMQNSIAQLQGMTKLVVPNSSVCPGWGTVTITPAAATATA